MDNEYIPTHSNAPSKQHLKSQFLSKHKSEINQISEYKKPLKSDDRLNTQQQKIVYNEYYTKPDLYNKGIIPTEGKDTEPSEQTNHKGSPQDTSTKDD